jgi:hypothetical protein
LRHLQRRTSEFNSTPLAARVIAVLLVTAAILAVAVVVITATR